MFFLAWWIVTSPFCSWSWRGSGYSQESVDKGAMWKKFLASLSCASECTIY